MKLPYFKITPLGIIVTLTGIQLLLTVLLTVHGQTVPKIGLLAKMLWGLNIGWILGFGVISIRFRGKVIQLGRLYPSLKWIIFFSFSAIFILIEEAITTGLTNIAPLFGAAIGDVYFTASTNYIDVILFHSVIVFLPQIALLGWFLSKYAISPFTAFLLYGTTGFINESLFSGLNPMQLPLWMLVYGLMVYLPAHVFATQNNRKILKPWAYLFIVIGLIISTLPVVAALNIFIAPNHPSIHFQQISH